MQVWNKLFHRKDEKQAVIWVFGTFLVFAVLGLIAAFTLTVEKIHLLQDPNALLSCSINLVLNCGPVMKTWQASVFGFPNSLLGIIGYSAAIAFAVIALARVVMPRWIFLAANGITALGAIFAYWLFFQSVYVIQVLCPWCLLVTFSTTIMLSAITHYNLRENTFGFSKSLDKKIQKFIRGGYDKLATACWIVLLIALVIVKFGDALFS